MTASRSRRRVAEVPTLERGHDGTGHRGVDRALLGHPAALEVVDDIPALGHDEHLAAREIGLALEAVRDRVAQLVAASVAAVDGVGDRRRRKGRLAAAADQL